MSATVVVQVGWGESVLEFVRLSLPGSITLDPDANTTENHFLSAPKINAQLHNVPILNGVKLGGHVWLTEPHVVEKGPGRTSHILDIPLTVQENEFAVFAAHHLGLETDRGV